MYFRAGISPTDPRSRFRYCLRTATIGYLLRMRRIRMFSKKGGSKGIRARQRPVEIMVGPAMEGSGKLTHDILGPMIQLPQQLFPRSRDPRTSVKISQARFCLAQRIRKALSAPICEFPFSASFFFIVSFSQKSVLSTIRFENINFMMQLRSILVQSKEERKKPHRKHKHLPLLVTNNVSGNLKKFLREREKMELKEIPEVIEF